MWYVTVPFTEMCKKGRWKVEFFRPSTGNRISNGYNLARLGDVFDERREFLDPQKYPDHVFNYLGLEHVESATGYLVNFQPRLGRSVLSRSKVFHADDVLYGRLRPNLNKVFVAMGRLAEGICSGEFYVLTPKPDQLVPIFARALLASRIVQGIVGNLHTGSALPRLQLEDLLEVELPIPPVAVQEKIGRRLDRENNRILRMKAEIAIRPEMILIGLSTTLEAGEEWKGVVLPTEESGTESYTNPLPEGDFGNARRRRPVQQPQLPFNA